MGRNRFCGCKSCKKAKRRGLVLGARWEFSWKNGLMRVSDYIPYHRFRKGRRLEVKQFEIEA